MKRKVWLLIVRYLALATLIALDAFLFSEFYPQHSYVWGELIATSTISVILYIPSFWFPHSQRLHRAGHFLLTLLSLSCWIPIVLAEGYASNGSLMLVSTLYSIWGSSAGLTLLSTILAIPLYVVPALRSRKTLRMSSIDEQSSVLHRMESVISWFDDVQGTFARERANLEDTLSRVQQEYQSQAVEIARADAELREARKQASHYEAVAKLTPKQQEILHSTIGSNKRRDYWVGVATTILASGLVAGTVELLSHLVRLR